VFQALNHPNTTAAPKDDVLATETETKSSKQMNSGSTSVVCDKEASAQPKKVVAAKTVAPTSEVKTAKMDAPAVVVAPVSELKTTKMDAPAVVVAPVSELKTAKKDATATAVAPKSELKTTKDAPAAAVAPKSELKTTKGAPAVAVAQKPELKTVKGAPAIAVAPKSELETAKGAPADVVVAERKTNVAEVPSALLLTSRKCATYCKLMYNAYPAALSKAAQQAWHDLVERGKIQPSDIFHEWQPLAFTPAKKYGHYAAQVVFESQFTDRAKLAQCFVDFAVECGFPAELAHLEFADDLAPTPYAAGAEVQASNHYVFGDKPAYNFKKHAAKFSSYAVAAQAFEHVDAVTGKPTTVMWLYLPGKTWDGTSCFNFMKEVVGRYYDTKNDTVLKAPELLTMINEAKEALNHPFYVLRFLLLLPIALFLNLSATLWEKAAAQHEPDLLASSGDREMAFLNLDAVQSKELCAAFKAAGLPPTAGLLYAVSTAYQRIVGVYPFGINVQASLQTRAFAPVVKERAFIGDWLIGPCYKVRHLGRAFSAALGRGPAEYWTPNDAKLLYQQLLHDVSTCTGAVRSAFLAREYGVVKGGPAPYQNQDLYCDLNRMNDSILFNNYGPREMHPSAKAVSWNWTGPGKLDCNTISVNGCTSITLASTLMGLDHVTEIRDEMHTILKDFVTKNQASA
jgi:hypothetical protein